MRFAKSLFKDSREQHRFPYRFDGTFGWLSEQLSWFTGKWNLPFQG
jgi:hypothetical protein